MTFDEFWDLPEDKKRGGYYQLSEFDRFKVRASQVSLSSKPIPCNTCKHRNKQTCKAHPEGISAENLQEREDDPYGECGNGIRYEPRE